MKMLNGSQSPSPPVRRCPATTCACHSRSGAMQRVPPGYRRTKPPVRPKLDAFMTIIEHILAGDKATRRRRS